MKEQIEKQAIEEMAYSVCRLENKPENCASCMWKASCENYLSAENYYTAGYRKQEWISVEERLPECDTNVLVITASGSFKIARVNIYKNGTVVLWATNDGLGERAITHWMLLPEPPKMKGD